MTPRTRRPFALEALEPRAMLSTDIGVAITGVTLPTGVRAGQTPSGTVTLLVTNTGTEATAPDATVDLSVRLRPSDASDSSQDTLLTQLFAQPVGSLAPGAGAAAIPVTVTVPVGFPGGTYNLAVVATPSASVNDSVTANNSVVSAYEMSLTGPDLTVTLGATTLPSAYVAGRATQGVVNATVTNSGDQPVKPGILVNLVLRLEPVEGGDAIQVYDLRGLRVGGMIANATKSYKMAVTLKKDIPANNYRLVAEVDPLNRLAETDETNNTGQSAGVITIAEAYHDLVAGMNRSAMPNPLPAGKAYKTSVSILATNAGNVYVPQGTRIDMRVQLFLVVDGATVGGDLLTTPLILTKQSLSTLAPGRTFIATRKITLPALAAGTYRFVGTIDTGNAFTLETSEANNTAVAPDFVVG